MKKRKVPKRSKRKHPKKTLEKGAGRPFLQRLSKRKQTLICLSVILLSVLLYFKPLVFEGKSPVGEDVIGSIGKTHQISEYHKQTGQRALWNPYVFCGMPVYHRVTAPVKSIDTLISFFCNTRGRQGAVYFLIGAVGMFLLLRYLGLQNFAALVGALAFLFTPHWQGILQAGHFSKFRSIMIIPWVLLTLLFLFDRKNLLSLLLFILAFSVQLRTQHYQIVFYTGVLMFFVGMRYMIDWVMRREFLNLGKVAIMLVVAVGVVAMTVAQPLLSTKEYTPYSIRGGTGEEGSTGLSLSYATSWSFSPREMFTLVMPRFLGGTSSELYTGDSVPALKGRIIPGYWGDMPFSGNTEYLGIVVLILTVIGLYGYRKNGLIISLGLLIIFSFLLSLGRHLPAFYGIFFKYMPAFNKFRCPSMILVLVMFSTSVISAFGVNWLVQAGKDDRKGTLETILWTCGILLLIGLVPFLFKGMFSFERAGEAQRYGGALEYLKTARYDLMKGDALRLIFLALLTCGLIWSYLKWLVNRKIVLILGVPILLLADLISVGNRFLTKDHLAKTAKLERVQFTKPGVDHLLMKDKGVFRIFPVGELFGSNEWSYHYQSIGGYDAAKLRVTQDVIESCLYKGWNPDIPVNWNVVNMLNAKYVIARGTIPEKHLTLVYEDKRQGYFLYRNQSVLPRAFFVGSYEIIPERQKRLTRLNNPGFHPGETAILEFDPKLDISPPDPGAAVEIISSKPDQVSLKVQNQNNSLLVLSEIYYPKGWHAYIDNRETEIFKTNHLLRSIFVPAGIHRIEFQFRPESYFLGVRLSRYSTWVIYLLLLVVLGRRVLLKMTVRHQSFKAIAKYG